MSEATTVYEGEPDDVLLFTHHDAAGRYERYFVTKWIDNDRLVTFLRTRSGNPAQ